MNQKDDCTEVHFGSKGAKIFALGFDMARFLAPGAARWWGGNRLAFVLLAFEQNQRSDAVSHRFVNNSVTLPPPHPPWALGCLPQGGASWGLAARPPARFILLSITQEHTENTKTLNPHP